jgi:hypothetical protein
MGEEKNEDWKRKIDTYKKIVTREERWLKKMDMTRGMGDV